MSKKFNGLRFLDSKDPQVWKLELPTIYEVDQNQGEDLNATAFRHEDYPHTVLLDLVYVNVLRKPNGPPQNMFCANITLNNVNGFLQGPWC